MTTKDWRAKAIKVIDRHPDDPEIAVTALEAGFREYASEFFTLTLDQQAEVAADTPLVTVKNIPYISEADQEKLTEGYIAHLKADVMPGVLKSVENYMIKKAEYSAELDAATGTLILKGITSWVSSSLDSDERHLELEASSITTAYTATDYSDGKITAIELSGKILTR